MQANSYSSLPFAVHREKIPKHGWERTPGDWGALSNAFPIPCRPFNSPNARGEARTRDVFINLRDPRACRTVCERYAHGGGLLQSAEWIRQPFKPLKIRGKAVENECFAYILWGKGRLATCKKTDMDDEMLQ